MSFTRQFSSLIFMAELPVTLGQACCSGGIPLAKNIGVRPVEEKHLNLRIQYEANILNSFYTGTEKLETATAKRLSQSIFLQGNFGLSNRFSVHTLFSWIHHKRYSINSPYAGDSEKAMGFGDAVVMLQYKVLIIKNQPLTWPLE